MPVTVILGIKQIPTKIIPLLILFGVNGLLLSTTLDSAPEVYQLAKNRRVDNRVVELELPVEGKNFSLIWVSEKNKQWGKNLRSRKGTHLYEIRDHPEWKGEAIGIYITKFENVNWKLKIPTLKEELKIFMTPMSITPSTINALGFRTIKGWKWDTILILLLYGSTAFFIALRKKVILSLYFGFILIWVLMDIRNTYDYYHIWKNIDSNTSINYFKEIKVFSDETIQEIGNGSWTVEKLNWPARSILPYHLAEKKFYKHTENPNADIIIRQSGNRLVREKDRQK